MCRGMEGLAKIRLCLRHNKYRYGHSCVPHLEHLWLWLALTSLWPSIQKRRGTLSCARSYRDEASKGQGGLVDRNDPQRPLPQAVAIKATIVAPHFQKLFHIPTTKAHLTRSCRAWHRHRHSLLEAKMSETDFENKTVDKIVTKNNKQPSRDTDPLDEERSVISFPPLLGPYSNHQNIYESNRQNNTRKKV